MAPPDFDMTDRHRPFCCLCGDPPDLRDAVVGLTVSDGEFYVLGSELSLLPPGDAPPPHVNYWICARCLDGGKTFVAPGRCVVPHEAINPVVKGVRVAVCEDCFARASGRLADWRQQLQLRAHINSAPATGAELYEALKTALGLTAEQERTDPVLRTAMELFERAVPREPETRRPAFKCQACERDDAPSVYGGKLNGGEPEFKRLGEGSDPQGRRTVTVPLVLCSTCLGHGSRLLDLPTAWTSRPPANECLTKAREALTASASLDRLEQLLGALKTGGEDRPGPVTSRGGTCRLHGPLAQGHWVVRFANVSVCQRCLAAASDAELLAAGE